MTVVNRSMSQDVYIEEIKIYAYFEQRGFTSVGAFAHFDDISKESISQISVSDKDKTRFEQILNNAGKRKHFQKKIGGDLLFCEVWLSKQLSGQRVIITKTSIVYNIFGRVKEERAFVTDLTAMIDYKITDPSDLQWLSDFIERVNPTH